MKIWIQYLRKRIIQTPKGILRIKRVTIIPGVLFNLEIAYVVTPVQNIPLLALFHLLHLPDEAASPLQLPFFRYEDLRQLALNGGGRVQGQVVLDERAGRQGLGGLVVLNHGNRDGRTLANSRLRRLFKVVRCAVAALSWCRRLQRVPLDARELYDPGVGVIVELLVGLRR